MLLFDYKTKEYYKICSICKEEVYISGFSVNKGGSDGYQGTCKECDKKRKRHHYSNAYGISNKDALDLIASRNGICDVCKGREQTFTKIKRTSLCIDHCHETGKIRGIICSSCNLALGKFKHNPELLREAANYLEKYQ